MTVTLERLNTLPRENAAVHLHACCGSSRWIHEMLARRPFPTLDALLDAADDVWRATGSADWDEAFAQHPRIGERHAAAPVSSAARAWSAEEQSTAAKADARTRAALAEANQAYEQRFGRIYIVCASGRTAEQLLADITGRMRNDPELERFVAAEEQRKITRLRLQTLLAERGS